MGVTVDGESLAALYAARLVERDPDVRLFVQGGYCNDPVMGAPCDYGFVGVIVKPYDVRELAASLAQVARASWA